MQLKRKPYEKKNNQGKGGKIERMGIRVDTYTHCRIFGAREMQI